MSFVVIVGAYHRFPRGCPPLSNLDLQLYESRFIERLGQYERTVESGLQVVVLLYQKLLRVDMRERVVEVPAHVVITKNNVVVTVDAIVHF